MGGLYSGSQGRTEKPVGGTNGKLGRLGENDTRTLTSLYNARPTWLDNAHRALDAADTAAYGWPADLPDAEILSGCWR